MASRQGVRLGSKRRPLAGTELEHAVARVAIDFPEYVVYERDGVELHGVLPATMLRGLVPGAPAPTGQPPSIPHSEVATRWEQARQALRRRATRITLASLATELGVSRETAKRYRRRWSLPLD